jgi:hypothetical protein
MLRVTFGQSVKPEQRQAILDNLAKKLGVAALPVDDAFELATDTNGTGIMLAVAGQMEKLMPFSLNAVTEPKTLHLGH